MQRIAFTTLIAAIVATGPALGGPLDLTPPAPSVTTTSAPRPSVHPTAHPSVRTGIGSISGAEAPAEPAPTMSYAATEPRYGGGFLEFLFRPQMPQRPYQPAPYGNPNYQDQGGFDPSVQGSRGEVDPRFLRQEVSYDGSERAGTVIINTRERMLYLVQSNGRAIRYGIGVGRPGFTWAGTHTISAMREWPDWRPPEQMLRRQPGLPRYMRGGPDNPLGARAMYLGSTLYRIHGSNEPWTIGTQVSSGCIRMRNEDVIDLYGRVRVGTRVVVI